jgi:hypothetical protein
MRAGPREGGARTEAGGGGARWPKGPDGVPKGAGAVPVRAVRR